VARRLPRLSLCSGATARTTQAHQQLIVRTRAGGITDILARLGSQIIGEQLGQAGIIATLPAPAA